LFNNEISSRQKVNKTAQRRVRACCAVASSSERNLAREMQPNDGIVNNLVITVVKRDKLFVWTGRPQCLCLTTCSWS